MADLFDYQFKVVLVGDVGAGKSSLFFRYIDNRFPAPTYFKVPPSFGSKVLSIAGKAVKVQVWDTASQERYRPLGKIYFREAFGCVAVFDLCNRESLLGVHRWVASFRELTTVGSVGSLMLVGNKADLGERQVGRLEGEQVANSLHCRYVEASAKTGENVEVVFETVVTDVLANVSTVVSAFRPPPGPTV